VAAAYQPLRIEAGRPVERLGYRRAPVDDDWLVVLARDGQAADMLRLDLRTAWATTACATTAWATVACATTAWTTTAWTTTAATFRQAVDAPEADRLVAEVELGQPGEAGADDDVSLGPRLEGTASPEVEDRAEHPLGVGPHGFEPAICPVEDRLLLVDLRTIGHRPISLPNRQSDDLSGVGADGSGGHRLR